MGGHATLSPARPERLHWLEPPVRLHESFADIRARLEGAVARGEGEEFYRESRRRLYRAEVPGIGGIAIKELYNSSIVRQFWFDHFEEHTGLREYRAGVEFETRGGVTLTNLGAARERNAIGLVRVLIFTRWLEGAVTLTRWLAAQSGSPGPRLYACLAAQVATAARLGLVHRRHSSNNLLVVMQRGEPVLHTIDFPHATFGKGLDLQGLACDVARIARWILHEQIWSRESVHAFFAAVAAEVRAETPAGEDLVARMDRELEAVIRNPSARREARL